MTSNTIIAIDKTVKLRITLPKSIIQKIYQENEIYQGVHSLGEQLKAIISAEVSQQFFLPDKVLKQLQIDIQFY
jgi:hypothetical protein